MACSTPPGDDGYGDPDALVSSGDQREGSPRAAQISGEGRNGGADESIADTYDGEAVDDDGSDVDQPIVDDVDLNPTTEVDRVPSLEREPMVADDSHVVPPQAALSPQSSAPLNQGARPDHVTQADVRLVCQEIGPGLTANHVRFGCSSVKVDGRPYGIVIGWWRVVRRDGSRALARDLNFREGGYDMAFDVEQGDAAAGIALTPGSGEDPPSRRR